MKCKKCDGKGKIREVTPFVIANTWCPDCGGSGNMADNTEELDKLINTMERASTSIYLVCEESIADDISDIIKQSLTALRRFQALKGEIENLAIDMKYSTHWVNGYLQCKDEVLALLEDK